MTYEELKQWYKGRELPKMLQDKHIHIICVRTAVDVAFTVIEHQIKHRGADVKNSSTARASKARLIEIKRMIESPECHTDKLFELNK